MNLKIIIASFLSLLISSSITAQEQPVLENGSNTHRVYCELLGSSNLFSTKVKISVDFGQSRSWNSDERLVDEQGNVIKFNSMVDGMNYMGRFGWKFVQAYVVTIDHQNVYHWLLYKDIVNDDDIFQGFMTKDQFKVQRALDLSLVSCQIQYLKKYKKDIEWEMVKEETLREIPKDDLDQIIQEWKAKTDDTYDFDIKITRIKN